jgi:hypothetical protein
VLANVPAIGIAIAHRTECLESRIDVAAIRVTPDSRSEQRGHSIGRVSKARADILVDRNRAQIRAEGNPQVAQLDGGERDEWLRRQIKRNRIHRLSSHDRSDQKSGVTDVARHPSFHCERRPSIGSAV